MRPIVMCGIPRSGSTLVWQILSEVMEDQEVPKVHPHDWNPDGSLVVATIRDPRDVVGSMYRVRLSRGGYGVGGEEGFENVLRRTKESFERLQGILSISPSIVLRYEEFYQDYEVIFRALEGAVVPSIPPAVKNALSHRFSLQSNLERSRSLSDFNHVGPMGIHGDHIGSIKPGSWEREVPLSDHSRLLDVCAPIVREWRYENQP